MEVPIIYSIHIFQTNLKIEEFNDNIKVRIISNALFITQF